MPCGGIRPEAFGHPNPEIECFTCPEKIIERAGLFVEEWDTWIHVHCLGTFLLSVEGKVVRDHYHRIIIPEGYPANRDKYWKGYDEEQVEAAKG